MTVDVSALIQGYAAGLAVTIDDSVADNVMNVVKSDSPCRLASHSAFLTVKLVVCPCWPCF